jgi:hypothetical protein
MREFDGPVFIKLLVKSLFIAVLCGLVGSAATGMLMGGGSVLGMGLLMSIPLGLFYGLVNGLTIGFLLAHRQARITIAGEDLTDRITERRWVFILISVAVIAAVSVAVFVTQLFDWLDEFKLYIIFGAPAILISSVVATNILVKWYLNNRPEIVPILNDTISYKENVWPPAPLPDDQTHTDIVRCPPELGDVNGPSVGIE